MDSEFLTAAATIIIIIVSRVMSHFEHKKNQKEITEIKLTINGEVEKKIKEAYEQGKKHKD